MYIDVVEMSYIYFELHILQARKHSTCSPVRFSSICLTIQYYEFHHVSSCMTIIVDVLLENSENVTSVVYWHVFINRFDILIVYHYCILILYLLTLH